MDWLEQQADDFTNDTRRGSMGRKILKLVNKFKGSLDKNRGVEEWIAWPGPNRVASIFPKAGKGPRDGPSLEEEGHV